MAAASAPGLSSRPQLWRLEQLIQWLRAARPLTTRWAAEVLEVSRRTVHNDLEHLRSLGVPVAWDSRKGTYFLSEPFDHLPFLSLRRTEWAAFLVARHALEALGDTPHAALLQAVTERLAAQLPETVRIEPDTLTRTLRIDPGPQPRKGLLHLEPLSAAIEAQRQVWIRYYTNTRAEETERTVDPYQVLTYQGRGYLIGYCHLRQKVLDFRLDRIRALRVLDEAFTLPPDFDLEAYLGPSFGMHKGERTFAVHVRFSPYQARWIKEEVWHESQIMTLRPDGTLDVRMQVAGLADVARWVLAYGGEAEVISPPVLRQRVATEARCMAARYAHDPSAIESEPPPFPPSAS
jgi:predicted DNA-binding transcriptional regulator YafY